MKKPNQYAKFQINENLYLGITDSDRFLSIIIKNSIFVHCDLTLIVK